MKIVAFAGKRFSGKDTACNYLSRKWNLEHRKFALKMKELLKILFQLPPEFDWDYEKEKPCRKLFGYSKREILQWYGTDGFPVKIIRKLDLSNPHIWGDMLIVLLGREYRGGIVDVFVEYGATIEQVLRCFYTGGFRNHAWKNFWIDFLFSAYEKEQLDFDKKRICISDLRFPNEVDWVLKNNGAIFYIERDAERKTTKHESESYLDKIRNKSHFILDNTKDISNLENTLDMLVNNFNLGEGGA